MRRDGWSCIHLRILALTLCASTAAAGDWPTFRGSDRTAISRDVGLLPSWPEEGPPLVWKAEGTGRGYSSMAIAGDRLYTLGDGIAAAEDKDEYLLCFELATGKLVWKSKTGPAWMDRQPNWGSSRSTPTVDGDRVYGLTAEGTLVCCDTAMGSEIWRKNLKRDFGGVKADGWGYSESVLVDGEQLVCTPGGQQTTMTALDKHTGEPIWKMTQEGNKGAGHASIVPANIAGTAVYVQMTGSGAIGVRAADGKLLWSYPIPRTTAVIPTPIVRGDLVFIDAGYKCGGALLKQSPAANGEVEIEEVYPLKAELANKHGGVVLVGDHVYGDSEDSGVPFCAELASGKLLWKKRGSGKGSAAMVAADGHLYVQFANGKVALVEANPEAYREVSSFQTPGSGERPSWSHPVILDGRLYVREHDVILCYDVRAKAAVAGEGESSR
jgi:outer membrane protein assembly factor BamB